MKLEGLEPPIFGSGIRRANQLRHSFHVLPNEVPPPRIEPGSPGGKPGSLTSKTHGDLRSYSLAPLRPAISPF